MVTKAGSDTKGLRDRALLLLGFAGAFRRSELVGLNVEDLQFCEGGLRVTIHKSKTDQEGLGATIGIISGFVHLSCCCGARLDRCSAHYQGATIPAYQQEGTDFKASPLRPGGG